MQLPEILERTEPDIVLTAGDRGEQLMVVIAGASQFNELIKEVVAEYG